MSGAPQNLGPFGVVIPEGWVLELLPRELNQGLLSRQPEALMVTIDFFRRGLRSGYSTTGRFIGEGQGKLRKKYVGRGWRQELVDDAVAHLQGTFAVNDAGASLNLCPDLGA